MCRLNCEIRSASIIEKPKAARELRYKYIMYDLPDV